LRVALRTAGIPDGFSVVPFAQTVPASRAREIDELIAVFDRVTTRPRWQRAVSADGPPWARQPHGSVCFFSAWDFHVPDDASEPWQLIEFNDNGSGFLFASMINEVYFALAGLASDPRIEPPPGRAAFDDRVVAMVEREAQTFFGHPLGGSCVILDDAESLARGHFRVEHELLALLLRTRGLEAAVGSPEELTVTGRELQYRGRRVTFVVNRSTDFLWQGDAFAPLRQCVGDGTVYVAPDPFSYLTRSDKRLFELLSHPDHDDELGITPDERAVLQARVPETTVLRAANVDALAERKHELFFKPAHGYASHGVLSGHEVGHSRLRRLLRGGEPYVAQRFVPKGRIAVPGAEPLQTDLRVWAYRGERYLVSGRAVAGDRRDLSSGGWIPTFVAM
jgi:hypothetical protein